MAQFGRNLRRTKKIKRILSYIMIYLSVAGLVTFSLFILEESVQTVMFGTWPARDARQWHIVKKGAELMKKTNTTLKIINYSVGWVQPLAFFSYRAYSKATDFYILGVESEIFAHAPELFIGDNVDFTFMPKRIEAIKDGQFLLTNGKLGLIFNARPELKKQHIKGVLTSYGDYFTIEKGVYERKNEKN